MNIHNLKLVKKHNIRSFDCLLNKNGNKIIDNTFIRSDCLSDYSSEEIDILVNDYKLNTIIDLRSDDEAFSHKYNKIKGVKYFHIPLLKHRRAGLSGTGDNSNKITKVPNMYGIYREIVSSKYSKKQLNKVLRTLMNKKYYCVLYHCTYGKDRTGIVTLLLLSMLDFDIDVVLKDYLYSNKVVSYNADNIYKLFLEKTKNKDFALGMKNVYLADSEYLKYIIDYMIEKRGTILNYIIKDIKISPRKVEKFKKDVLVMD